MTVHPGASGEPGALGHPGVSGEPERASGTRQGRPWTAPTGLEGLRGLYERYCDQEARALLSLVPRAGLRSLLAAAYAAHALDPEAAAAAVPEGGTPEADPMARTVRFARTLLPLPPYEVWVRAYLHDRGAFLEALDIEPVPVRSEPVLVDVRPVDESWMAELHLVRSGTEWRGFLRFSSGPEMSVGPADYRTAYIFRDGDVQELRRRFQEFTAATLASFLRSVSP